MCGLRKANRNIKRYNGFLIPFLFGGHSELVPRLPIPNRTVKRLSADDSMDTHVKVGHCQALIQKPPKRTFRGFRFVRGEGTKGWRKQEQSVKCGGLDNR